MANDSTVYVSLLPTKLLLFSVIFKSIAMCVGVTGNVAVIICNLYMEKEKTPTSYLVANLAVSDLLVCLTLYPIWIVEFIQTMLDVDSDQDLFCKLSRSTSWALLFVSTATLSAITVDRYLFIVKPLKYPMIVTRQRIMPVILGIWFAGCVLFYVRHLYTNSDNLRLRSFCNSPDSIDWCTQVFTAYIPLLTIFSLNFEMFTVARNQRQRIFAETTVVVNNNNEQPENSATGLLRIVRALKSSKTFLIVVVVLAFCCFIPTVVGAVLYRS